MTAFIMSLLRHPTEALFQPDWCTMATENSQSDLAAIKLLHPSCSLCSSNPLLCPSPWQSYTHVTDSLNSSTYIHVYMPAKYSSFYMGDGYHWQKSEESNQSRCHTSLTFPYAAKNPLSLSNTAFTPPLPFPLIKAWLLRLLNIWLQQSVITHSCTCYNEGRSQVHSFKHKQLATVKYEDVLWGQPHVKVITPAHLMKSGKCRST